MNERDKELAKQADKFAKENRTQNIATLGNNYFELFHEKFADLIRADEREAIAQMFEGAPALIPFAQNDKSGCMICGFTPKLAMEAPMLI